MENTIKVHVLEAWIPEGSNYFTSRIFGTQAVYLPLSSLLPSTGQAAMTTHFLPTSCPTSTCRNPPWAPGLAPFSVPGKRAALAYSFLPMCPLSSYFSNAWYVHSIYFSRRDLRARKEAHLGCMEKMIPRSKALTNKSILNRENVDKHCHYMVTLLRILIVKNVL